MAYRSLFYVVNVEYNDSYDVGGKSPIGFTVPENMTVLTAEERHVFTGFYVVIILIGVIANVCAVISISKQKKRYIQKICIISLALSDLVALISMGINNLETFSHPMINWTLGEFMCHAIPIAQVFGILTSSFGLLIIGLDRYRNVVYALNNQWNPQLKTCLITALFCWLFSLAVSYPMGTYFSYEPVYVIYFNKSNESQILNFELYHLCTSFQESSLVKYHISLTVLIFLPIFLTFIWFYYHIAQIIWRHRKPLSSMFKRKENDNSVTKSTEIVPKTDPVPLTKQIVLKKKNIHVERKIRTFKIIITLSLVFIICRLPYWVYFALINIFASLKNHWVINYLMIMLSLLNCALNPFLYAFLTPSLKFMKKLNFICKDFLCEACCSCYGDNYEDFEKDNQEGNNGGRNANEERF